MNPSPPSRMEAALLRLGTAGALIAMLSRGGRWWMVPLVAILLLLGLGLLVLQSMQPVAPFVYVVF